MYEVLLAALSDENLSWFWIETTEPGYGKFVGKGRNILLALFLTHFALDVIDETEPYLKLKEYAVAGINHSYEFIVEAIQNENEDFKISCNMDDGALVFTVEVTAWKEEEYEEELRKTDKGEPLLV